MSALNRGRPLEARACVAPPTPLDVAELPDADALELVHVQLEWLLGRNRPASVLFARREVPLA